MFGSMDSMAPISIGADDSSSDSSSAPVTRAEFEALKQQVDKLQQMCDDDKDEDEKEGEDYSSDDSATSSSIAGASKSSKPSPMAKKMVSGMNPLRGKAGAKPPFS